MSLDSLPPIVWNGLDDLRPHLVAIATLRLDPKNARKHSARNLDAIAEEDVDTLAAAIREAMRKGPFRATGNANSNGNALARIAEAYLGAA